MRHKIFHPKQEHQQVNDTHLYSIATGVIGKVAKASALMYTTIVFQRPHERQCWFSCCSSSEMQKRPNSANSIEAKSGLALMQRVHLT